MRKRNLAFAVPFFVMAIAVAFFAVPRFGDAGNGKFDECYVGVAFCGNTTAEAKLLIDKVKGYSNFFILQSGPVSKNEIATNEICDYAVASGLNIVVFFGDLNPRVLTSETAWRTNWVSSAKPRWGDRFLGVYYYDEPGGIYLDTDKNATGWHIPPNSTYDSVAGRFVQGFQRDPGSILLKNNSVPIFVSDYALYWFDYLAGYDVVLTQIGWNNSLPQEIALVKGAARMQNKEWGAMITWKYDEPPYLNNGTEIYNQMVASYEAGAKYIAIFNYPQLNGNAYGVMQDEHFEALERFWHDATNYKILHGSVNAQAALVLPRNYGWGMRNPEDQIWGFWEPDENSPQIWAVSRKLLSQYGFSLDIIYEDAKFPFAGKYNQVYYWNSSAPT